MARRRDVREVMEKKQAKFLDRLVRITDTDPSHATQLASNSSGSSFWINPLRAPVEQTLRELTDGNHEFTPYDFLPNAFALHSEKRALAESAVFQEGRVFIQNLSSMLAVAALDPQPGQSILDVCASPGGKSARAASLTNNEIVLWANDSLKPRVTKMRNVFDILGVTPKEVTTHAGQYLDKFIDQQFDSIMLDAQCSGEAMIDVRRPSTLQYWSEKRITEMSFLQRKMLATAWKLLRPGGVLVYSTCTFAPEENESPIDALIRYNDNVTVEPLTFPVAQQSGRANWNEQSFSEQLQNGVRVLPSSQTEAFFVARLRKAS